MSTNTSGYSESQREEITRLVEYADRLADSLKQLESKNLSAHSEKLRGLQWWAFAERRIEDWERYRRFLARDGVI